VLLSDIIGALAGGALAYPAAKDQILRYARQRELHKAVSGRLRRFRTVVAAGWEKKRSDYDGLDSFLIGLGGLGLLLSFALKLFDL
jgi:hypothetical protein